MTILAAGTSSPVRSLTFLYRILSDVPSSNWLKWTVLSWVAEYRPTGTFTSPKLRAPFQMVLGMADIITQVKGHPPPLIHPFVTLRS